jgi:hypothetical protein
MKNKGLFQNPARGYYDSEGESRREYIRSVLPGEVLKAISNNDFKRFKQLYIEYPLIKSLPFYDQEAMNRAFGTRRTSYYDPRGKVWGDKIVRAHSLAAIEYLDGAEVFRSPTLLAYICMRAADIDMDFFKFVCAICADQVNKEVAVDGVSTDRTIYVTPLFILMSIDKFPGHADKVEALLSFGARKYLNEPKASLEPDEKQTAANPSNNRPRLVSML